MRSAKKGAKTISHQGQSTSGVLVPKEESKGLGHEQTAR